MRATFLGLAVLSVMALPGSAMAQDSMTVIRRDAPPDAMEAVPMPPERGPVAVPDSTGSVTSPGCASTTTRRDDPDGSQTTVRQERCNPD